MLSDPEMNLTSSFLFSGDQLECSKISPVYLVLEMIYNPLGLAFSMVTPTFFAILRLQDPRLQCFPLSHNRNAHVTGGRTSRYQLYQTHPHLQ